MKYTSLIFICTTLIVQQSDINHERIQSYVNEGSFRKAITFYRGLPSKSQNNLSGQGFLFLAKAYENINQEDSAFYYYKKAKETFQSEKDDLNVAISNLEISSLLESQNDLEFSEEYFIEFWKYANRENNRELIAKGHNYLGRITFLDNNTDKPKNHFKEAYRIFDSIGRHKLAITNLMNIGVIFSNRLHQNDSARMYYKRAIELLRSTNKDYLNENQYHDLLNNIGNSYRREKNYLKSLDYYKKAETLEVNKFPLKTKKILYGNMDAAYYYLGDYENAYNYLFKYDSIKDKISLATQNSTISDIQEKYNNARLRANNLEIETQRLKNRNFLIGALAFIVIGLSIGTFLYKNSIKKRKLIEQDMIIKQQKVDNLIKENELVSIDAMIAGQEKERQKVANELHDDLGSLMATIKLHFDKVDSTANNKAFDTAKKLLDKAYDKIRGIAHSNNSGVMSNNGLIPALEKMANIIKDTKALNINIEHYGLAERIDNSLELTIFRIIQELITNILKHAEATEANIQITQHESNLNIIVEDNGKGFVYSQIEMDKGMGLNNLEKKIEFLEGNFSIDSYPNKGTTIIIDIPV